MSAFICSDDHISALVRFACVNNVTFWFGNPSRKLGAGDEQEIVDILYAENVKSVNYRYIHDEPEPTGGCVYNPNARTLTPVEAIKLAQSLDYQSCEHPEWATSEAFGITRTLKAEAIRRLPGYELAEWSI
jgi:hypothetical protein